MVTILMLWSPFLSLSLAIVIAYAVTSRAAWDKSPSIPWRLGVVVSWIGYLLAAFVVFLGILAAQGGGGMLVEPSWGVPLVLAVALAGLGLLPLSFAVVLHTILQRRRSGEPLES